MAKQTHRNGRKDGSSRTILFVFIGFVALGILLVALLYGTDIALFDPKGHIANEQRKLMLFSAGVLFGVAVPTLTALYFFAWKYRDTNSKNHVTSDQEVSSVRDTRLFNVVVWAFPIAVFVALSLVMWSATHRLEPQRPIAANAPPLEIEVIALRWKWLFIYPEQQIATVNFVQIPTNTSVRFDLTADEAPMSSFWIPNLSGQLYAMTGHVNPLHLIADTPGNYRGSSAEINGDGFAGMKFDTRVSTTDEFTRWLETVRSTDVTLTATEYKKLLEPSENNAVAYYAHADTDLYDTVVQKYMGSHDHLSHDHEGQE